MVGDYLRRESVPPSQITFSNPPMAYYHITEILKGPPIAMQLRLKYDFGDESQSRTKDWVFEESMMPEPGSSWILFIPFSVPSGEKRWFETYRGSLGRVESTPSAVKEIRDALKTDLYQSRLIVVATYTGCEHVKGVIEAYYKRIVELKTTYWEGSVATQGGNWDKQVVAIKYANATAPHSEQSLSQSMMPEMGSKWILFIGGADPDQPHIFETTSGARGRVQYSRQALDENLDVLEHLQSYSYVGCHKTRTELYKIIEDN